MIRILFKFLIKYTLPSGFSVAYGQTGTKMELVKSLIKIDSEGQCET